MSFVGERVTVENNFKGAKVLAWQINTFLCDKCYSFEDNMSDFVQFLCQLLS